MSYDDWKTEPDNDPRGEYAWREIGKMTLEKMVKYAIANELAEPEAIDRMHPFELEAILFDHFYWTDYDNVPGWDTE